MRREGKAGPFIPCEVRAQTGPTRATTPAVACRRRRATTAVGARAKAYPLGRRRLCPGGNACVRATTSMPGRRQVPCGRVFFHKHPKLQRSGDDVYVRATTSTSGRQRLRPGDNVYARATTGAAWEGCFFTNTPNFSARATTSALA